MFQFLKGSIQAINKKYDFETYYLFQFLKGSIQAVFDFFPYARFYSVSIP